MRSPSITAIVVPAPGGYRVEVNKRPLPTTFPTAHAALLAASDVLAQQTVCCPAKRR